MCGAALNIEESTQKNTLFNDDNYSDLAESDSDHYVAAESFMSDLAAQRFLVSVLNQRCK